MRRATVVIGSNFGDEGKGLITDHLVNAQDDPLSTPIVARFNGGSQAAHTVQLPSGKRHVFHHFGSGTLRGADTFLSSHFIVNPLLWYKEYNDLVELGVFGENFNPPNFYIHRDALVSTPYDMLINQELERNRGKDKHGSCGIGINVTVDRSQSSDYCITYKDLSNMADLYAKIKVIKNEFVLQYLRKMGVEQPTQWFMTIFKSSHLEDYFFSSAISMNAFAGNNHDVDYRYLEL